jgi:hypothetical protein
VPSRRHQRKFEIDLMVLTRKHIHFLEVKNWSGELVEQGNRWVQIRRGGEKVEHPDLTAYNSQKQEAVVEYLRSKGVELDKSFFSQKIVFMNQNLKMSKGIAANPDVVSCERIGQYLSTQRGASFAERFVHSAIEVCLDFESSSRLLGGLFQAMPGSRFDAALDALSSLETWDKVVLHGGKVLTGDCLKLFTAASTVDLKSLPSGTRCRIRWTRSRFLALAKALLTSWPLGKIQLPDRRMPVKPKDRLKFHAVGEEAPCEMALRNIDCIVRG